jgi:hypothetical protein
MGRLKGASLIPLRLHLEVVLFSYDRQTEVRILVDGAIHRLKPRMHRAHQHTPAKQVSPDPQRCEQVRKVISAAGAGVIFSGRIVVGRVFMVKRASVAERID